MGSGLELQDARVNRIALEQGVATVALSHACIHKSKGKPGRNPGSSWSQEARLRMFNARLSGPLPDLPNTVVDGFMEIGGLQQEVLPLPFRRKVGARLWLRFADGTALEIVGEKPVVELLGEAIFLEND